MDGKVAGFTLIEAIFVLAITTITLAIGFPAFGIALQRQRVATTMHLLSADMAIARSTALMRRANVVVCPRNTASGCSSARDWSRGWLVFHDPDGNERPDAPADILRATAAPAGDAAVLYLPSSRRYLRYQPDGRSAGTNLSVHVCAEGAHLGSVVVNNLGRIRSQREVSGTRCPYG